jgi:hypothetical protein
LRCPETLVPTRKESRKFRREVYLAIMRCNCSFLGAYEIAQCVDFAYLNLAPTLDFQATNVKKLRDKHFGTHCKCRHSSKAKHSYNCVKPETKHKNQIP